MLRLFQVVLVGHETDQFVLFYKLESFLFLGCKFVAVTNTVADTIHAATISNCAGGSISQTEYWNLRRNISGYWHNENSIKNYLAIKLNGSVLVSS